MTFKNSSKWITDIKKDIFQDRNNDSSILYPITLTINNIYRFWDDQIRNKGNAHDEGRIDRGNGYKDL